MRDYYSYNPELAELVRDSFQREASDNSGEALGTLLARTFTDIDDEVRDYIYTEKPGYINTYEELFSNLDTGNEQHVSEQERSHESIARLLGIINQLSDYDKTPHNHNDYWHSERGRAVVDAVLNGPPYESSEGSMEFDDTDSDLFQDIPRDPVNFRGEHGLFEPELCSWTANEIRRSLKDIFQNIDETMPVGDVASERIRDVTYFGGHRFINDSTIDRRIIELARVSGGLRLYAWTDIPQKGRLFKRDDLSDDAINREKFYIGLARDSYDTDHSLFIPILSSSLEDGCSFVLTGSNPEDITFNNPQVLSHLRDILATADVYNGDEENLAREFLDEIIEALRYVPEGVGLQLFLEQQLYKQVPESLQELYNLLLDNGRMAELPRRQRLLTTVDGDEKVFNLVGNIYEREDADKQEGRIKYEFFLEDAGVVQDGDLSKRVFRLWQGLDPDIYENAVVGPRFSIEMTEFEDLEILSYDAATHSYEEADGQSLAVCIYILHKKLLEGVHAHRRLDTRSARPQHLKWFET